MANAKRFSPSAGWDQVRLWINRHFQAIIALAGVFFLLPALVLSFLGPAFAPPALDPQTTSPEVIIAQFQAAFRPLIPWMIVLTVIQMIGQLAILAIAAARASSTVGGAISLAFSRLGYLILAQIVIGFIASAVLVALSLVVGLAAAAIPALGILFGVGLIVFAIYLLVRLSLVSAVLVAEDARWPIALLQRSWAVTSGNAGMIFLFYVIVAVVFVIVSTVVSLILGLVLNLMGSAGLSILELIMGIVSAAGTVIFTLMPLSVWHQLTDGSTPEVFS